MNTLKNTTTDSGTNMPLGEKIAAWAIVLIIIYLVIAQ